MDEIDPRRVFTTWRRKVTALSDPDPSCGHLFLFLLSVELPVGGVETFSDGVDMAVEGLEAASLTGAFGSNLLEAV